jgi:hypothetical protein
VIADRHLCVARFAERASAAMLDQQRLALRLRLGELLFELGERSLERRHLRALVGDLLPKAVHRPLAGFLTFQRRAGQVVLAAIDRQFRLAQPLGCLLLMFHLFLLEHVLIRDGNRDLRLDLQQLILHVENHLLDHLRRVLRLVDEVVQVRFDERADAFK